LIIFHLVLLITWHYVAPHQVGLFHLAILFVLLTVILDHMEEPCYYLDRGAFLWCCFVCVWPLTEDGITDVSQSGHHTIIISPFLLAWGKRFFKHRSSFTLIHHSIALICFSYLKTHLTWMWIHLSSWRIWLH
jgi:hypothetical protein